MCAFYKKEKESDSSELIDKEVRAQGKTSHLRVDLGPYFGREGWYTS